MKITDIRFVPIVADLPPGKAYGMAKALATSRQSTVVRLSLEDGTEGVGEAWGIPAVNVAYLPFVNAYLIGTSVFDIEHAFGRILARHYHFGVQGPLTACISGIDMAAKDATGKILGVPVHRLIGGKRWDKVPVYASGGYLTETPERDFEPQIAAMVEARHKAVKIKIGLSPKSNSERVAAARRLLGPDVDLMVDINSNYTLDLARESIARIAEDEARSLPGRELPQPFLRRRWEKPRPQRIQLRGESVSVSSDYASNDGPPDNVCSGNRSAVAVVIYAPQGKSIREG